jgi:hypothetical protein
MTVAAVSSAIILGGAPLVIKSFDLGMRVSNLRKIRVASSLEFESAKSAVQDGRKLKFSNSNFEILFALRARYLDPCASEILLHADTYFGFACESSGGLQAQVALNVQPSSRCDSKPSSDLSSFRTHRARSSAIKG